jgi:pimeloyl-ACP methyl ester carboxylesterase
LPKLSLQSSPLNPGVTPVEIFYRDEGEGPPLVLLHGGWGYSLNPFNRQIEKLRQSFRVICPDRSGYGRSTRLVTDLPADFHHHAAAETLSLLDALNIKSAYLWGHSDGAVIAAIIGFTSPERVRGLILEAFHYFRLKPRSREFFEALAYRPESLGTELCERFALEFGEDYWRQLITGHAKAWVQIALASSGPRDDLYAGRLQDIRAPTLFIHGRLDQRTEPGELDAASAQLPNARMRILETGAHSPHSETATADIATKIANEFLTRYR